MSYLGLSILRGAGSYICAPADYGHNTEANLQGESALEWTFKKKDSWEVLTSNTAQPRPNKESLNGY